MKKKLIAGNWKMNGSLAANEALVGALLLVLQQPKPVPGCGVCASAVLGPGAVVGCSRAALSTLGAQDVSAARVGRIHR
jgi:triosephosphate isomerase